MALNLKVKVAHSKAIYGLSVRQFFILSRG